MGYFKEMEVSSVTKWIFTIYIDDNGKEYEVIFTKNYDRNLGIETKEVVNIEKDGITVDAHNPVWIEIQAKIETI